MTFLDLASSFIRSAQDLVNLVKDFKQTQLRTQETVFTLTVGHTKTVSFLKYMTHKDVK